MAISVHCPTCHEKLSEMRQDCANCGVDLPPGVLYILGLALGDPPRQPQPLPDGPRPAHLTQAWSTPSSTTEVQPPAHNSALRPWLAAALSLVCGLGQLYNGQVLKGVVLIILGAASVVSFQLLLGKMMVLAVWTYAVVDAYLVARHMASDPPIASSGL